VCALALLYLLWLARSSCSYLLFYIGMLYVSEFSFVYGAAS
jgi:hypothetical protein